MTQSFFDQNRSTLLKFAQVAYLLGWVLLTTFGIYFIYQIIIYTLGKCSWQMYAGLIISVISSVFFSFVFLLIAQFLHALLNPRYQTNWLFRNAPWVFRLYAAVLTGYFLFNIILHFVYLPNSFPWQVYLNLVLNEILRIVRLVNEVMLLYALAHLSLLVKKYLRQQRLATNFSALQTL